MISYCSKCDINWARLWEQTDEANDETYEFCPKCKSDRFLQPGNDIVSYIKCPVTGKIKNVMTGKTIEEDNANVTGHEIKLKIYEETWEQWRERVEETEDATPLNQSVPVVKRKSHFEIIKT